MKILSFIVPAYNSGQYLDKCIQSMLCRETLNALEIIVVNDGSTDDTQAVAERYCQAYPGTVRLISQPNKGHGGALNAGCGAATGKYLKVIDADDWVETRNLPDFIQVLARCDSDVVLTHHYTRNIATGETQKWMSYPPAFGRSYSLREIMADRSRFERSLTFHGIAYRTAFYHEHGISLSEHVFYEDHEYATFPCCYAGGVTPLDLFIYNYRIGDVQQSVSDANQLKRLSHTEAVLERLAAEYRRSPLPENDPGRDYCHMKMQVLLLSYITTVMLVEPDRKRGRELGLQMMERFRSTVPQVYALSRRQYRVFALMNRLHVSKPAWEKFLRSPLYRRLRGQHDFH